jgi:hypothetical protein
VVTHENGQDIVMIRAAGSEQVEMERVASNFAWSWLRFTHAAGSIPADMVLLSGSRLSIEGKQVLKLEKQVQYVAAKNQAVDLGIGQYRPR